MKEAHSVISSQLRLRATMVLSPWLTALAIHLLPADAEAQLSALRSQLFDQSNVDFNVDGVEDLAIGVPGQAVGGEDRAGSVHVIYGVFLTGLSGSLTLDDQIWTQDGPDVANSAAENDEFGSALVAGNFRGAVPFGAAGKKIDLAIERPGCVDRPFLSLSVPLALLRADPERRSPRWR